MAGTGKKWLIGCGAGCGVSILLSILLSVGGALFMTRPMNKAVNAQKELAAEFGAREDFTPPPRLTPQRIKAFLAVRQELMGSCSQFEGFVSDFQAMEELDSGEGDPQIGEVMGGVKGVMGAVFGLVSALGEVTRVRNQALHEHGMGMGEYTWIYILAFNSYLEKEPNTGIDSRNGHGYRGKKLRLMSTLMENHAVALEKAGNPEAARIWRDEIGRLKRVDEGVPFSGIRLPDGLAESFAPFRKYLEKYYCPAMAEFDLDLIEKKGMSFHAD
ncbi:MAG: hypothetical protein KOO60_04170 [Gemmatimonadales bacterium]|nr:hypothetical protein [Gemmatimonadales bacterium]